MTIELTLEEKTAIINQHIKNHSYAKYNLDMTLVELESVENKDFVQINEVTIQIQDIATKIAALTTELNSLQ